MIAHVVLLELRPTLSLEDRLALADAFAEALRKIPSIRRARVGPRVVLGREYEERMRVDYGFAAVLEFDDLDGLNSYLEHPLHAELGKRFFDAAADALAYDFALVEGLEGLAALRAPE